MKRIIFLSFACIFIFVCGWFAHDFFSKSQTFILTGHEKVKTYPLAKYSIENLSKTTFEAGTIEPSTKLAETDKYTSYLFHFRFKPDFENEKSVTGQINIPAGNGPFPVTVMIRGYIDQSNYKTGDGTRNAASYFAENGYITIAPDFLGYGGSDPEAGNIFETRFQTYTTVLSLLSTLESLKSHPGFISGSNQLQTSNNQPLFLWAHSNGGQIALTVLETVDKSYPTVLWAPVSKPFPYSVLYYTDDSDDGGKLLRSELSKFENDYNTDNYSLTNYLNKINSPILLQQGTLDEAVPKVWSDKLSDNLTSLDKEVNYKVYPGADHNMRPFWNDAVFDDLKFFNSHLQSSDL